MKRREFLGVLTGAVAMSRVARAQQAGGMRHIGIIVPASSTDMKFQIQVEAFEQELKKFGWTIGQNVQIEVRWATADPGEIRRNAAELAALKPDVILAHGSSTLGALQQLTRTLPIVFPVTGDPVAAGFVESLCEAGRQYHRFCDLRIQHRRKMAGVAQANYTSPDTSGCLAASRVTRRARAIWLDSIRWLCTRGGGQTIERARCRLH